MIAFIEGKIRLIRRESIVVDTGGIGYEVFVSQPQNWTIGESCFLLTYQQFGEDYQTLFGFGSTDEYDLFCALIGVKGIGCRTALKMLGAQSASEISRAIANEDVAALKKLPGIGARSAGQIVLDLRGVVAKMLPQSGQTEKKTQPQFTQAWQEAREALFALGYKQADIAPFEKEFGQDPNQKAEDLLRISLQSMARTRGV